jgi:hypothetical protein
LCRFELLSLSAEIGVASAERSASRCTSSATTEKPRPAAGRGRLAAFSASTLVCSVIAGNQLGDPPIDDFTQALDALLFEVSLNSIANRVHTADGILHRLQT